MRIVIFVFISFFLASCNQPTQRRTDYEIQGIDVSRYQSHIDWKKVANQDITFAFVKASEGETISDNFFCQNWKEMKDAGIRRGAYHFFRPKTAVLTQVRNFMDNVFLEKGDLPPVLDVEVLDGVSSEDLVIRIKTWLEIIENEYNIRPIIYTNLKFYNTHLAETFAEYPVWIARYNHYFEPQLANDKKWMFWQYGNRGRIDGINGDVDFNVFHGTMEDFEKLCYTPEEISFL
ncbi:MAG TPA: glycoside hydrolase family 25 protein [Phaeodactylibacter sp.]|nr:glycoside hydrolase family 25 protein [Phaeodactylibacter sp.]